MGTLQNLFFAHEFQHSMPKGGVFPSQSMDEIFSTGIEAVTGNDEVNTDEVPYTFSLLEFKNYQNWPLLCAYLAYNYRGTDTTVTLAGLADDLLLRWARGDRDFNALRNQLSNTNCIECASKPYFNDALGAPLPVNDRFNILLQNWRVATYVNNDVLHAHQYGYPPQFTLSPTTNYRAWQRTDAAPGNDPDAIPPEVVARAAWAVRETTMVGQRYPSAAERPPGIIAGFMSVKFTGSEYWVIRSDPSLAGSAHTLLVRVQPEGLARGRSEGACIPLDGRLTASVIVYSVSADSLATGRLWSHPEWATEVLSPRWQEADSLGEAMEFLVPGFGTSANAAVLVLSHGDGPSEGQARVYPSLAALRYRVNLAVHTPTSPSIAPIALSASPAFIDDRPAWSPNGQELLFERKAAGTGLSRIYRDSVTRVVPGPPVPLTAGSVNQYQPDWSPRGDWVAFTQDSAGGSLQRDVWLYNVGTGVSTQLTNRPGWETSAHSNPTDSA